MAQQKIAIVTGASRGLGCAIAEALAEAGADITIVARNCADLARVERRIQSIGRDCLPIAVDLTQEVHLIRLYLRFSNGKEG